MSDVEPHTPLNELEFSRQVEAVRPALRGYLMSLSPDRASADDVFQETMLFLWQSRAKFAPGTSFRAWAFRCGYFCALAKKRDRFREKAVCYPDEFFTRIAEQAERHAEHAESRMSALRDCLAALPAEDMAVVRRRYYGRENGTAAPDASENPNRFHKAISRLRLRLKLCIEKRIKAAP